MSHEVLEIFWLVAAWFGLTGLFHRAVQPHLRRLTTSAPDRPGSGIPDSPV